MRIELWTLTIVLLTALTSAKKKQEVRLVFGDSKDQGSQRTNVEFIENTDGQTYLDIVTYRDRFVLDLLLLNNELRNSKFDANPDNSYLCPRILLENFDLRGLNTPLLSAIPPKYCPRMKQTCCLPNDIIELEARWSQKLSPEIKYIQHYFKYYVRSLLSHSANFTEAAVNIRDNHKKQFCKQAADSLIKNEITEKFKNDFYDLLDRFLTFDYRLKRGFICLLCDYENLGDFDTELRLYSYNRDFCQRIVNGTLDFQHAAHKTVYRYINTVSVVAQCQKSMLSNDTSELNFIPIDNSQDLEVCKFAKDNNYNLFVNCLSYCSNYQLWKPEAPTYASIETLSKIHQLAKDFLFKDSSELTVSPPRATKIANVVDSKRDSLDVFSVWEHVFSDANGIKFEHFSDINIDDF